MLSTSPLAVPIPTLTAERLILRGHCFADLPPFTAMFQLPAFFAFLGGKLLPEAEGWTKARRNTGQWRILGLGHWPVEEKATGRFIGAVGFADWPRALAPCIKGEPETGWVLDPRTHGRGYATEVVQAALAWGARHFTGFRTVCIIDPENTPSLRVAEKCCHQVVQPTTCKQKPVLPLARPSKVCRFLHKKSPPPVLAEGFFSKQIIWQAR